MLSALDRIKSHFYGQQRFLFWGIAVAFVLVYVLILYWFGTRDFYHKDFFEHGSLVRYYELFRLIFIFCFAWLIYAAGIGVLSLTLRRRSFANVPVWERYPLGFLIGVAVWSVPLYAAGLASLYRKPLAVGLALAVVVASIPHFVACIEEATDLAEQFYVWFWRHISRAIDQDRISIEEANPIAYPIGLSSILVRSLLFVAIGVVVAAFLLAKGLYPGGGHDYFNHYFPFYLRVIQTGSILPNDVWYHFYYSKGDVLYFLAMLLTDPLAPQLVTAGFILCAAWIVYAMLRRVAPLGLLPWVGVLLFFAFFIYTPGPREFMNQGGWGELEKEHELTAVTILGVIWCLFRLFGKFDGDKRPWILGLHASVAATIIVTLELGVMIGLYLAGYMVWFLAKRQWRKASIPFFGGVTAAASMMVIVAINYALTGLLLDQAIPFTWPITNVARLANWGPVFEVLSADKALIEYSANAAPWSRTVLSLLPCYLRLEIWWPLVTVASLFAAYRLIDSDKSKGPINTPVGPAGWALLWFAGTVALVAIFGGGRSQSVTFYRLTSFSYTPTLCLGLVLWHFGLGEDTSVPGLVKKPPKIALVALLLVGTVWIAVSVGKYGEVRSRLGPIIRNAITLWCGQYSLAQAYQNQQGWPGRMPWGGIYPGVAAPWHILPPNTRVWSFHIWSYCMLPDCNFQGINSFIFSPQWRIVYFDTPEHARAALHDEGLDYFFFSKEILIEDSIGRAPLFSPDNIGKYLAVRWTDGTSYLLTWPGSDTRPINESFLSSYRELTAKSSLYKSFNIQEWKTIAAEIAAQEAEGEGLHPFALPWCYNRAVCIGN